MLEIQTAVRLLQNSGFRVHGSDGMYIYLEDPSCILRSFTNFLEYAWIIIALITVFLLFGWAISLIRGAKNDLFTNMRNIFIMFGTLSVVFPIINIIYGEDIHAMGCRQLIVNINEVNKLVALREAQLGPSDANREHIDIWDSAATYDMPYADLPINAAGANLPDGERLATATGDGNAIYGPSNSGTGAQTIEFDGDAIVYIMPDGTREKRSGGTSSWRTNNPGNIRISPASRKMGALGAYHGFAVFPDEATGMHAIYRLLQGSSYRNLTIAGAINRWAPPSENQTSKYIADVQDRTGLDINRFINSLNDAEMDSLANAIRAHEGWGSGRITRY